MAVPPKKKKNPKHQWALRTPFFAVQNLATETLAPSMEGAMMVREDNLNPEKSNSKMGSRKVLVGDFPLYRCFEGPGSSHSRPSSVSGLLVTVWAFATILVVDEKVQLPIFR